MKALYPNAEQIQKCRKLPLFAPLTLLFALVITGQADAQQIITYDAPNSGTSSDQGTFSTAINLLGIITGYVTDNTNGTHGFVRSPNGRFTEFDAAGANPVVGCTCPNGINDLGIVAGYAIDTNNVYHGFVRTPDGQITTFNAPSSGTLTNQGTFPVGINNVGAITGNVTDNGYGTHGFVRTPNGQYTEFDAPGANPVMGGTYPNSINDFGVLAGVYYGTDGVGHGFVRTRDGRITTFDPPNAVGGTNGTVAAIINDLGEIAGNYYDARTNVQYGYVRWPDGQFTVFAAPGAGTVAYAGTQVNAVNLEGATTGDILDDNFEYHSFVRAADGTALTYDVPGQIMVPGSYAGSFPVGINAFGVIAGHWRDPNYVYHGYLRLP